MAVPIDHVLSSKCFMTTPNWLNMSGDSPSVYFAKCNLVEVTEILVRTTVLNEEDKQVLEKLFWEQALIHGNVE